ncbi:MAG: Undecaprenyl-diphosphatase [Acidobacteriales bacterium]|nr:Undecaprenyl-diphosphatase [Terriglobales bacterium]
MNDYLLSVLLGIIEGVTEFLPVSSTAHLRISEAMLGIDLGNGYWKMYTIVIQLGAILCLPIYFRERIWKFLSTFPTGEKGDRTVLTHPLSLTMIAFVFTAGPAFLMTKIIGKHLESLYIMGSALLIGGIVMWIVDVMYANRHHTESMEQMSLGQAIWIGLCQVLSAVFPGTSRSMSTIAAGQIAGMSRSAALEFSFFLSIPTMVAATCYDLLKTLRPSHGAAATITPSMIDSHGWVLLGIGFVVSFIVALGVVAWFMKYVRQHGFVPFAIYRIIIGIAVLVWAMKGAGH